MQSLGRQKNSSIPSSSRLPEAQRIQSLEVVPRQYVQKVKEPRLTRGSFTFLIYDRL